MQDAMRSATQLSPETIGPYRVLGQLGRGGMGVVFRAVHVETHALVALKTVRQPRPTLLAGIRREIHALSRIDHPSIVRVVGSGLSDGVPWYAMELLEGQTLADLQVARWNRTSDGGGTGPRRARGARPVDVLDLDDGRGPAFDRDLDEPDAREARAAPEARASDEAPERRSLGSGELRATLLLIRRLCTPLAFLHGEGIVHRDLKPANVFVRPDGTPVLVDFGIVSEFARDVGREVLEVGGVVQGTSSYMAPEQIRGEVVDARADLYALGVMLFECLVGHPPFNGEGGASVYLQHISTAPPSPSSFVSGIPAALEELVMRLLAKRPRDRIGYADDVAAALDALLDATAEGHVTTHVPRPPKPYLYRPGLSGRGAVLARAVSALDRARTGEGALVLVGGESGVGKTRLAVELATAAARQGMATLVGECLQPLELGREDRVEVAAALHAFRPVMLAVADRCRELGLGETEALLGPRGRVLAPFEPTLAALPGQSSHPEPPPLGGEESRARAVRAVTATLVELARREPLLLVIDDVQWADEASIAVLDALVSTGALREAPFFVVATYRSDESAASIRAIDALAARAADPASGVFDLRLDRLDTRAVRSMVADMLALPSPPDTLVQFLAAQSEGNPFFVAEYLRAAVFGGLLRRDPRGTWELAAATDDALGGQLQLPRTVQELVRRRVAGVGDGARRLAELAAVLGVDASPDLLVAAAEDVGLAELEALDAIAELVRRQLLEEARGPGSARSDLRFVHHKLREVIYADVAEPMRARLHGAAARALEAGLEGSSALPLSYARLAQHWELAGDRARALRFYELAGEHALDTFAYAEASAAFERALRLDADAGGAVEPDRRARWRRQCADAAFALGDLGACGEHANEVLEEMGVAVPEQGGALYVRLAREVVRQTLHLLRPAHARSSADGEVRRSALREGALAASRLADRHYFADNAFAMITASILAVNLAERSGLRAKVARPYTQIAYVAGLARLHPLVRRYLRRARETALATEDPGGLAQSQWVESLYHLGFAEWPAAESIALGALSLATSIDDRQEIETVQTILGHIEHYTGRFVEAAERYVAVADSARRRKNRQHEAWGAYARARSLLPLGRLDEAELLLAEALRLLESQSDVASKGICHGLTAMLQLARGDRTRARRAAEHAFDIVSRGAPSVYSTLPAYAGIVEVALDRWQQDRTTRAASQAHRAIAELRRFARVFPLGEPTYLLARGRAAALAGDARAAVHALEAAVACARRSGMPFEQALASLELARVTRSPVLAARAGRELARLGCVGWAAEAQQLASSVG
jgi:serine/threonine protein kinase/tetratricopeptide (TPR) repeat protein